MTSPREAAIEAMAKAMCEAQGLDWDAQADGQTSGGGSDDEQEGYREMARAAIEAYERALAAERSAEPPPDASGSYHEIGPTGSAHWTGKPQGSVMAAFDTDKNGG